MQYMTIHRLETNRLRNVAKFFGHLLYTDAIDWNGRFLIPFSTNPSSFFQISSLFL